MVKFFLLSFLLPLLSLAGTLNVSVKNEIITAKACNLKKETKAVWFFVGKKGYSKNGIGQREERFEGNCAVKSYDNSSNQLYLKDGEVYAAYDYDGKQPVQKSPEVVQIPSYNSPQPQPQPPVSNEPNDPRKESDPKKVHTYAEQAANFFANRV
ncbi:MAG: hypothetical protein KDD45_11475, partial [Bdellovibrionales bacterium]|nr:hypothetical protein [Bdellovibrionales bacterium]